MNTTTTATDPTTDADRAARDRDARKVGAVNERHLTCRYLIELAGEYRGAGEFHASQVLDDVLSRILAGKHAEAGR